MQSDTKSHQPQPARPMVRNDGRWSPTGSWTGEEEGLKHSTFLPSMMENIGEQHLIGYITQSISSCGRHFRFPIFRFIPAIYCSPTCILFAKAAVNSFVRSQFFHNGWSDGPASPPAGSCFCYNFAISCDVTFVLSAKCPSDSFSACPILLCLI